MKKILLIDDDAPLLEILAETLQDSLDCPVEVTALECSKTALERLKSHQYDLVITDYRMPNVSGKDIVDYCLANQINNVVLISGECPEFMQTDYQGKIKFIPKPVHFIEFVKIINNKLK